METMRKSFSNTQIELLKLYSTNLSEEDLSELKSLLAEFYSKKAIKLANTIWKEKSYTNDTMDRILNGIEQ